MSYENGHIFKPVDPSDVSAVLGVPSFDYGTLCMSSAKINPYSIIQPRATQDPGNEPESWASPSTCTLEKTMTSSEGVQYQFAKWGVFVPKSTRKDFSLGRYPWKIKKPHADSFQGPIVHFDGYRHDVSVKQPILDTFVEIGMQVKVMLYAQAPDVNIVAADKNMGGALSIANVLSNMYFGASLFITKNNGPTTFKASVVSNAKIGDGGKETRVVLTFPNTADCKPVAGDMVHIVPWVTTTTSVTDSTTVYSVKMGESVLGFYSIENLVAAPTVGARPLSLLYEDSSTTFPSGTTLTSGADAIRMSMLGVNTYTQALTLKLTKVEFSYVTTSGEAAQKTVVPSIYPSNRTPEIPANSEAYLDYYVLLKSSPGANDLPLTLARVTNIVITVELEEIENGSLVTKTRTFDQSSTDHNVEIKQITWTEDEPPA